MASSGATAWAKYFQGKGDIQTTLKKASPMYDAASERKLGELPAGTKITYLKAKQYESKALIQYKDKKGAFDIVRVTFDNIAKPGVRASGAASLKPQAFNVKETKYTISEYKTVVSNAIEERNDLSGETKAFLSALFDYWSGGKTTSAQVKSLYDKLKSDIPINDINKDFGEVIGPVACYTKQLLKTKNINLSTATRVYMPLRPNEPLMDYSLIDGQCQYVISAKSGTTTNVVKPGDIIDLINKNPEKKRALENTKEYKLLEMLSQKSILEGGIYAVSAAFPEKISEAAAKSIDKTARTYDKALFANFISNNDYLKMQKEPTLNQIMYECEKMIQAETKTGSLNMNSIFSAAIEEQVIYIKYELDQTGIGKFGVIASDDIVATSYGRVYLRTKNGYTRAADRMGIQV